MYSYIKESPLKIASLTQIAMLIYTYEQTQLQDNDYDQLFISKIFVKCFHNLLFSIKVSRSLLVNFARAVILEIYIPKLEICLGDKNAKQKLQSLYRMKLDEEGELTQSQDTKRMIQFHENVLLQTIFKLHNTLLKIDEFYKEYIPMNVKTLFYNIYNIAKKKNIDTYKSKMMKDRQFNLKRDEENIIQQIDKEIKYSFQPKFEKFISKLFITAIVTIFEKPFQNYHIELPSSLLRIIDADSTEIKQSVSKALHSFGQHLICFFSQDDFPPGFSFLGKISKKVQLLIEKEDIIKLSQEKQASWKQKNQVELDELNSEDENNKLIKEAKNALINLPKQLFILENHFVSLNYMVSVLQESLNIVQPTQFLLKVESLLTFHNAIINLFKEAKYEAFTLSKENYQTDPVYIISKYLNHLIIDPTIFDTKTLHLKMKIEIDKELFFKKNDVKLYPCPICQAALTSSIFAKEYEIQIKKYEKKGWICKEGHKDNSMKQQFCQEPGCNDSLIDSENFMNLQLFNVLQERPPNEKSVTEFEKILSEIQPIKVKQQWIRTIEEEGERKHKIFDSIEEIVKKIQEALKEAKNLMKKNEDYVKAQKISEILRQAQGAESDTILYDHLKKIKDFTVRKKGQKQQLNNIDSFLKFNKQKLNKAHQDVNSQIRELLKARTILKKQTRFNGIIMSSTFFIYKIKMHQELGAGQQELDFEDFLLEQINSWKDDKKRKNFSCFENIKIECQKNKEAVIKAINNQQRGNNKVNNVALGCYSYNNLMQKKVLVYYRIRKKIVPKKILNNLKYYFFARSDGSFDVKVVFKENSGMNLFVKYPQCMICCLKDIETYYTEVAMESIEISLMRVLYLKKTLNRKGLVTFGNSTFNVNRLYKILLDISSNKIQKEIDYKLRLPEFKLNLEKEAGEEEQEKHVQYLNISKDENLSDNNDD